MEIKFKFNKNIDLYLLVYLFFVLFCPPILPKYIGIFLLCAYTLSVMVFHTGKMTLLGRNVQVNYAIKSIIILAVYWLLSCCVGLADEGIVYGDRYFKICYRFIMLLIILWLFIPYIQSYCRKRKYTNMVVLKHLVYASCIQFAILVLFIVVPEVRDIALSIMSSNTGSEATYSGMEISRRFYGFALTLQDGFSYGMGIAAMIALYLAITKNTNYIIAYAAMTLVAAFNARTGLLIIIIGTIYLIFNRVNIRTIKVVLYLIIMCGIGIYAAYLLFPVTVQWVMAGFLQLLDFLLNRSYGDYGAGTGNSISALFSEGFWELPSSILEIIFGTGHASGGDEKTDVGYVNYIWAFGVIGSVYLYSIFFNLYRSIIRYDNDYLYKKLLRFVLVSMFLGNIKFDVFTYASGIVIIMILFTMPGNYKNLENRR